MSLVDAYRPLYMREDVLGDALAAWVEKFPKSHPVHLARGTYYRKLGELNRGTGFVGEVGGSKLGYKATVFGTAQEELLSAMPLTPKPYLAALKLLNIARYRGDERAADRFLELGNAALPKNMLLRGRYQDHLAPRWGGSYVKMEAFVVRCRKEGLPAGDVGLIAAIIDNDKGLVAETAGDVPKAVGLYAVALDKARNALPRLQVDYLSHAVLACRQGMLSGVTCP